MEDHAQSTVPAENTKTGLIYDAAMGQHQNEMNPNHPETPERIEQTWQALQAEGLLSRCTILESREAGDEEVLGIHSKEHVALLASTADLPQEKLNMLSLCYNSIFINPHTHKASRLAAGCVVELMEAVVSGRVRNGLALVRPPGHHAECSHSMGFCHLNNVAIAAKYALEKLGLQRVLIVDWDIHHGNGTQHQFYEENRVLYFSLHRYDDGLFFPCADDANFDHVGSGPGEGFNINVAWNGGAKGDLDYLLAFYHILMPVAMEFDPELVIVSCGFDAGRGDQLGGYRVTPAGYAHMTHLLMSLARGKLVLALEGGYSLSCIRESSNAILRVLLGDAPLPELDRAPPSESTLEAIRSTVSAHASYWKSLSVFKELLEEGEAIGSDSPPPVGLTPETGTASPLHGRGKASESLERVMKNLSSDRDLPLSLECHEEAPSYDQDDQADSTTGLPGGEDRSSEQLPPASSSALSHEQIAEARLMQDSTAAGASGSSSNDGQEGASNQSTMMQLMESLEREGHTAMFAVSPKSWCEHLASQVKPLPPGGIDSAQHCETCGSPQEPWVCLNCYHAFCGRYVNEHMVVHQETAGHKMALSLADLSVWCYLCDSYISNHVLTPAINSAHHSKFGTNIDGSQ